MVASFREATPLALLCSSVETVVAATDPNILGAGGGLRWGNGQLHFYGPPLNR
jgi:hypothetical protein